MLSYRAEDGRPICYCCLRVCHLAKYCHNRMYSCYHLGNETTRQRMPMPTSEVSLALAKSSPELASLEASADVLKKIAIEIQENVTPWCQDGTQEEVSEGAERSQQSKGISAQNKIDSIVNSTNYASQRPASPLATTTSPPPGIFTTPQPTRVQEFYDSPTSTNSRNQGVRLPKISLP